MRQHRRIMISIAAAPPQHTIAPQNHQSCATTTAYNCNSMQHRITGHSCSAHHHSIPTNHSISNDSAFLTAAHVHYSQLQCSQLSVHCSQLHTCIAHSCPHIAHSCQIDSKRTSFVLDLAPIRALSEVPTDASQPAHRLVRLGLDTAHDSQEQPRGSWTDESTLTRRRSYNTRRMLTRLSKQRFQLQHDHTAPALWPCRGPACACVFRIPRHTHKCSFTSVCRNQSVYRNQ